MIKAVKILMTEDGQMLAKPCDADESDVQEAMPFDSLEAVMEAVPALMEQSYSEAEEEDPMMEGEAEFAAGFKSARGGMEY